MITGVHAIIFTTDAEGDRAFFHDVLQFPSVDAGGGWLIFALPPAELAAHPAEEGGQHELYLMCDDVHATVAELRAKGVDFARAVSDEGFGSRPRSDCPAAATWGSTNRSTHRRRARAEGRARRLRASPSITTQSAGCSRSTFSNRAPARR